MRSALGEIEFLVRSEHRVDVLAAVAEGPHDRAGLRATTGASASTISRTLREFETRHWIRREGGSFEATPLGRFVVDGLLNLLERMETERRLREVLQWLPADGVGFDAVRRLHDAEVVLPTESDPTAPIRRAGVQLHDGARLRFLTTQVAVQYLDTVRENVVNDGMRVEGVVTPDVHDTLVTDSAMAAVYRDLHQSEDTAFFVAEDVPLIVQIVDDDVGVGLVDEAATPRGLVCSDDEHVHEWAIETFETCRGEADPISEF
jgi:predicted transcriptional regulator